jgi:protein SCO1
MDITNRRELLGSSLFALLNATERRSNAGEPRDEMAADRERIQKRFLPNVPLLTHDGKKVRFYDDLVKDKIVTINFMYAKCEGVCPGITANLVKVQRLLADRIGREIFMYSITLKPEEDNPRSLNEYAKACGAGPGWTFLGGNADDIELLRRKLGFTNPSPELDKDKSQHIGNVRYGNERLCLWASCPGLAHAKWIAESISWVDRRKLNGSGS